MFKVKPMPKKLKKEREKARKFEKVFHVQGEAEGLAFALRKCEVNRVVLYQTQCCGNTQSN